MKKTRWWTILFWILLILFVSINVAIQITGNTYIYPAIIYNYANIDDLDIFPARAIANGTPEPWPVAKNYNKATLPDSVRKEIEKNYTATDIYEFNLIYCDKIVNQVMEKIAALKTP